jgi:hypothetical protein
VDGSFVRFCLGVRGVCLCVVELSGRLWMKRRAKKLSDSGLEHYLVAYGLSSSCLTIKRSVRTEYFVSSRLAWVRNLCEVCVTQLSGLSDSVFVLGLSTVGIPSSDIC